MNPIYKFELNRPTVNLLNPKTVKTGLLSTSTGALDSSNTSYQSSDFIPVTPGTNYKLCDAETFTAWAAAAACFYTANKVFISGSYGIDNTPSNAAYLRVSYPGLNDGYGVFPDNVSSYSDYVTPIAYPVYKDDLAKDFEKESNQEFFRAKLSGKLTFQSLDYDFIVAQPFDFQFVLEIFISYNAGQTWTSYWRGTFWKTDCEFDNDAKTVVVQPTVWDQYNDVLAGMDKEYNLIELAPEIVHVKADKRPMIQVYVPGQSVVGCFLSGMWWEQEAEPETDETKLVNDFKFSLNKVFTIADVSGSMSPQLPAIFGKSFLGDARFNPREMGTYEFTDSEYKLVYAYYGGSGGSVYSWTIIRISDNVSLWAYSVNNQFPPELPHNVTLTPVADSGATGNVTLYVHDMPVYSRFVLDTPQISGLDTYPIPADDIVENNRNYTRVIGYYFPDTIYFSTSLTSTPNQWGLYQPGQYYQPPYLYWNPELFPVARNAWGRVSIWFTFSAFDWIVEESGRQTFTIRHAYPLASVISVLLAKIAPNITHDATTDYSQFLYGTNLIGITQTLLITPKSNLVTAGYDQPAQKAPITLKNVTDMLRDCFRCYWFVDEQNRFRVEHIQYFRNGGSYSGSPVVGIDLTTQQVSRNGKAWAFARDQFKFDKPTMAARYQFGWMDDVTQLFDGFPIDIISKYVNPDNIEQIDVSRFTSDVDYILLNPGAVSKDGFVLLSAKTIFSNVEHNISGAITNGGSSAVNSNYERTDYLPVESGGVIRYSGHTGGVLVAIAGYDSNKVFVGVLLGTGNFTNREIQIPGNVSYIRSCGALNYPSIPFEIYYSSGLSLPYYNFVIDGNDHILQNAYVSFCLLQQYYAYDMPAPLYSINGEQMMAQGIKKLKNQTIRFPLLNDPDLVELVKTNLGNGTIEKLSVNLSSRNANATLKYDTE